MKNRKLILFISELKDGSSSNQTVLLEDESTLDILYKGLLVCYNHCDEQSNQNAWEYGLSKCGLNLVTSNKEAADQIIQRWNHYDPLYFPDVLAAMESLIRNNAKELSPLSHNLIVEVLSPLFMKVVKVAS